MAKINRINYKNGSTLINLEKVERINIDKNIIKINFLNSIETTEFEIEEDAQKIFDAIYELWRS